MIINKHTIAIGVTAAASLVFLYVITQRLPSEATQAIPNP